MEFDKEIYHNQITDKHYLIEPGSTKECSLYGNIKTTFKENISGFSVKRPDVDLKDHLRFDNTYNYKPITRKFEGYFQLPKPLDKMFCNLTYNNQDKLSKKHLQIFEDAKQKIKKSLKTYFPHVPPKNYNFNYNSRLDYLNQPYLDTTNTISRKKVKQDIRSKIEEEMKSIERDNKAKKRIMSLDRTLTKFEMDRTNKLFNVKLKQTLPSIINKIKRKDNLVPTKLEKSINPIYTSEISDRINERLTSTQNFTYRKSDSTSFKPDYKITSVAGEPSEDQFNITNYSFTDLFKSKFKQTDGFDLLNQLKKNDIDELNESNDSENYKKMLCKTSREIGYKNVENLVPGESNIIKANRDKQLLLGFKTQPLKEKGLDFASKTGYDFSIDQKLYFNNLDLLKRVNPIAYNIEKNKEKMDLMFLKKRQDLKNIKQNKEVKLVKVKDKKS